MNLREFYVVTDPDPRISDYFLIARLLVLLAVISMYWYAHVAFI